jgi:peptidylprolyl isomerase
MDFKVVSTFVITVIIILGSGFLFYLFTNDNGEKVNYTDYENVNESLKEGEVDASNVNSGDNSANMSNSIRKGGSQQSSQSVLSQVPDVESSLKIDKLKAKSFKKGEGTEVSRGDEVVIHYIGRLQNGTVFDSSLKRGQPLSFQIGTKKIIQGLQAGLMGMKEGGARRLYIPSKQAYGKQGKGDAIPPNANLVFDVELLKVKKAQQTQQQGMMQQMQQ